MICVYIILLGDCFLVACFSLTYRNLRKAIYVACTYIRIGDRHHSPTRLPIRTDLFYPDHARRGNSSVGQMYGVEYADSAKGFLHQ
ncbi:hypothetical protein P175DRAFT_0116661 [Aspergillus ochraceoroseus IBT 24754]|uniref:Uncharacterized protein n=1 Tax=Aspergillus ochraceoroseus IBT 24754 TaxID=1392256 RepID=A0A2T5LLK5_9EURO|nr:uncharacterized protein P175DRAFT_0116661 [Aspergillus ochraceoroseus IBT 24754]PTU17149.1 hypothetical protein P175DRAFT_0116661 [Aspergillus ochraceoroseus IBT 24754]